MSHSEDSQEMLQRDTDTDSLFNYEILGDLSSGVNAKVYRARCKRGRLRNRLVAIKQIRPPSDSDTKTRNLRLTSLIHATLCHPAVISLVSAFSAPTCFYQVLEFCEHGSLEEYLHNRNPSVLVEDELRGAAKVLVDALTYLKKERILHRDVKPSNVLLASEYRLKLSGFSAAVKLASVDSTEIAFCGSPNYVSPEILSGQAYTFPTDVWSLGCVLLTCLWGHPAFQASHPEEVFDRICHARYTLPEDLSYEAQDLVSGLLQKNPNDRLPLHRILAHPFFKPSLPVKPLTSHEAIPSHTGNSRWDSSGTANVAARAPKQYPTFLSRHSSRPLPPPLKPKVHISSQRVPLEDITNLYQGTSSSFLGQEPLRAASAPTLLRARPRLAGISLRSSSGPSTPALTADSGTPSASSIVTTHDLVDVHHSPSPRRQPRHASPRLQLKHVPSDSCIGSRNLALPQSVKKLPLRLFSHATTSTAVSRQPPSSNMIEPSSKPANTDVASIAFNTLRLKAQTYKASRGQLIVLPSKSLLVDFREGERRKGRQGKEVLLINPDGSLVQIFDAPHLSTPCCLVEPTATYTTSCLPAEYLKLYEDAAHFVDQLNARLSKLVHYLDDARCTLMANGPPGDIEVLIPENEDPHSTQREAIRLRLQRKKRTLEVSRHIAKAGAGKDVGEWTRKILPLTASMDLTEGDLVSMDGLERLAMAHLGDFLRICIVAEGVEDDVRSNSPTEENGRERLKKVLRHIEEQPKAVPGSAEERSGGSCRVSRAPSVASSVVVQPRPGRFTSAVSLR